MANDDHALAEGKTFPWHEVYTRDVPGTIAFYKETLGWESTSMNMGEMGDYHMLVANGQPVCGVFDIANTDNPDHVPPHWSTYIAVDDVDARVAKCLAAGGAVVAGPFDVPTVGRMALIADSQGAHVWLYKSASG